MYHQTLPWQVNYDPDAIPPYTLPDLLTAVDGSKIDTAEKWQKNRPALLKLFRKYMYGAPPPEPDSITYHTVAVKDFGNGIATRTLMEMTLAMKNGKSMTIPFLVYIPCCAPEEKFPVFCTLTFGGLHAVESDPDLPITALAMSEEQRRPRGFAVNRFPLEAIMRRKFALVVASYNDIFADRVDGWKDSIYALHFSEAEMSPRLPEYTAIGAWAWGLSRLLDHTLTLPQIDPAKTAVAGHSRLGKTALWAGVTDERFQLICVNDSGCGGAALSRRLYGETLYSMYVHSRFGETWFTDETKKIALTPEKLPIDQHQLIALAAPRKVAVHSATEDQWADPTGEYLGAWHAGEVYRLFGKLPLTSPEPPPPETPLLGDVGYYLRTGKHDINIDDWQHYMDMMEL